MIRPSETGAKGWSSRATPCAAGQRPGGAELQLRHPGRGQGGPRGRRQLAGCRYRVRRGRTPAIGQTWTRRSRNRNQLRGWCRGLIATAPLFATFGPGLSKRGASVKRVGFVSFDNGRAATDMTTTESGRRVAFLYGGAVDTWHDCGLEGCQAVDAGGAARLSMDSNYPLQSDRLLARCRNTHHRWRKPLIIGASGNRVFRAAFFRKRHGGISGWSLKIAVHNCATPASQSNPSVLGILPDIVPADESRSDPGRQLRRSDTRRHG